MAVNSKAVATNGQQTIEELHKKYESLNKRKFQAEAELKSASNQLAALQKEAREKYGTDDLAELRAKLVAMQQENEQKRAAYQAELERIEGELTVVEQRFAANVPPENAS
jgi:hypothetical protein